MQEGQIRSDQIASSPLTHGITHSDDIVGRPVGVVHPLVGPPKVTTHLERGALHSQQSHERDRNKQRHAEAPRRRRHLKTATKFTTVDSTPLQGADDKVQTLQHLGLLSQQLHGVGVLVRMFTSEMWWDSSGWIADE